MKHGEVGRLRSWDTGTPEILRAKIFMRGSPAELFLVARNLGPISKTFRGDPTFAAIFAIDFLFACDQFPALLAFAVYSFFALALPHHNKFHATCNVTIHSRRCFPRWPWTSHQIYAYRLYGDDIIRLFWYSVYIQQLLEIKLSLYFFAHHRWHGDIFV